MPETWTHLTQLATAWMLTYAIHSSLLIAIALIAHRLLERSQLGVQEALWKLALVGGLITASLQLGLGWQPWGDAWSGREVTTQSLAASTLPPPAAQRPAARKQAPVAALKGAGPSSSQRQAAVLAAGPRTEVMRQSREVNALGIPPWRAVAVGLWLLGGLLGVAAFAASYLRLSRRLRSRGELTGGGLVSTLRSLERRMGIRRPVRLTCSPRLHTPIAHGLTRGEICVPVRALSDLEPEQQETMLAHELAHVVRHDPAWLVAGRLVESALFFQPLSRLALRRLQEVAEFRCDDWAADATQRPLDLARCLTRVADWSLERRGGALPVPGITDDGSGLGRRVHRLLHREQRAGERAPRWLAPLAASSLLVLVAAAAPGASGPARAPEAPAVASAPKASPAPPAPEIAPAPATAPVPHVGALAAPPAPSAPSAPALAPNPPAPALAPVPPAAELQVPELPAPELAPAPPAPALPASLPALAGSRFAGPVPRATVSWLVAAGDAPRADRSEGGARHDAPAPPVVAVDLDDLEDVQPEVAARLRALEEELQQALAPMVEDLDATTEALERDLEVLERRRMTEVAELETMEKARLAEIEKRLQEELERSADRQLSSEQQRLLERRAEEIAEISARMAEEMAPVQEMIQKINEQVELKSRRLDEEIQNRLQPLLEGLEPRMEEIARMAQRLHGESESGQLSEEERQQLRKEMQRLREEMRPSQEEIEKIRQHARALAEERERQRDDQP